MTGAGSALAPAVIEAFLALGADVLAADARRTALDDLRARVGHHERLDVAECDARDAAGAERLFEAWARRGAPDVVVHLASAPPAGPLEAQSADAVERGLGDALDAAAVVLRQALRTMAPAGRGSVVLVGAGGRSSGPRDALPAAAGAALAALVEARAGAAGPRVNAVLSAGRDEARAARAAAWLAGDDSDGISGACVRLSQGEPPRRPDRQAGARPQI